MVKKFQTNEIEFAAPKVRVVGKVKVSFIPPNLCTSKYIFENDKLVLRTGLVEAPKINQLGKPEYRALPISSSTVKFSIVHSYLGPGKTKRIIPKKLLVKAKKIKAGLPKSFPFVLAKSDENATYNFNYFSSEQNLPGTGAHCLVNDSKGRLWVGVDNGLALVDGDQIKTFTNLQGLTKNHISSILEDQKGNIWLGSEGGGLLMYNGNYFTKYSLEEGLGDNMILRLFMDKNGSIWIGTANVGLIKYDGHNFYNYSKINGLTSNVVTAITQDDMGRIFFATINGGLNILQGDKLTILNNNDGLNNNYINAIYIDKSKNMWLGFNQNTIQKIRGNVVINYHIEGDKLGMMKKIIQLKSGDMWFGSYQRGAFILSNNILTNLSVREGIKVPSVCDILQDLNNNIWLSTWGGGVYLFQEKRVHNYSQTEGLSNPYNYGILEDKNGEIWFASNGGGISIFNGKGFKVLTHKEGLCGNNTYCLLEDQKGRKWVGTQGNGISMIDNGKVKSYNLKSGLSNLVILYLMEDHSGKIWVATRGGGINVIDNEKITHITKKEGLSSDYIVEIFEDSKNRIWVATENDGLNLIEGNKITQFTVESGLSNNSIFSFMEDKFGQIWIGSFGGGLDIFNGKTFTNYNIESGLPDNTVSTIKMDGSNNIWAGTYKGLMQFFQSKDKKLSWRTFDKNDGFKFIDFNEGLLFTKTNKLGKKNTLWGCMGLVVSSFNPPKKDFTKPNMTITQLSVNQRTIDWRKNVSLFPKNYKNRDTVFTPNSKDFILESSRYKDTNWLLDAGATWDGITSDFPSYLPVNLVLNHDQNKLSFSYSGLKLEEQNRVVYRYCLEGYDNKWNAITTSSNAEYMNLEPGKYKFRVRSRGKNFIWSDEAVFSFTILPPWYQTWWARGFQLVGLILVVMLIVKWRTNLLKKRQKELESTVKLRTNELSKEKHLVEEKNRAILDSITYAKRIQSAILPQPKLVKEFLEDSFILYKPKDIVAGDFYWLEVVGDTVLFAAADCTGHGVPGAMVSVVCNNGLNRAVREFGLTNPNEILDKTRELVIQEFEKSEDDVKDGMDISLCALNVKTNVLKWSGANNPLWILRDQEILEFKGDKQPIGKHFEAKPFTQTEIQLQNNDSIYIFTDGFQDQFGGPKEKKFRVAQMRELFLSLSDKLMEEQRKLIDASFEIWRGELEQVDDVCVIGVRI